MLIQGGNSRRRLAVVRMKILVILVILLLAFVGLCFLSLKLSELFAGVEGAAINFLICVLIGFYNVESLWGYLSAAAAAATTTTTATTAATATTDSGRRRTRTG